jgi:hypothetical protein
VRSPTQTHRRDLRAVTKAASLYVTVGAGWLINLSDEAHRTDLLINAADRPYSMCD